MRIDDVLVDLAKTNGGLVTTVMARDAGVSSQRLTRLVLDGLIARVARGVYAVGSTTDVPDPRHLTIAWRVVMSDASAVAWWGVDLPKPPGRLHVTAPRSRGRWRDAEPGARRASLEDAVAVVDAFLRQGLSRLEEFEAAAMRAQGPASRRLRLVASLADPASGSILESLCRVLLWRNGLVPERTQYPFNHPRTGWVGYLDFAWPSRRVSLECDGYEWHADRGPFQKDRRRWSALNRAAWLSGVVTWFDVTCDPDYVVALVRDLLDCEIRAS